MGQKPDWIDGDPPLTPDEKAMVYDATIPETVRLWLALLWLNELRTWKAVVEGTGWPARKVAEESEGFVSP